MTELKGREKLHQQVLEDLRKQLTKEELERVHVQREFQSVNRDSNSWPLGVAVDPLRLQLRRAKSIVEKGVWQINNLVVKIKRMDEELASGKITEELRPGLLMSPEEVELQKKYSEWLIEGELMAIPQEIWKMRGIVGQHDVGNNVIMSEEDFDAYLGNIREKVKRLGFVLF